MKLGIHFVNFNLREGATSLAPTLSATARAAEEAGCTTFTLMDHWFQMEQFATAQDPMLEGYTSLGFLAGQTQTMTLGLLVTGVTYRHPGLLAKIVTTLDVLSGGRAQLGIGAAWYEREHRGLGVPFPPVSERFERLEETLQICQQMWSDDDGPYEGRHYQLAETICSPRPSSSRGRRSSSVAAASGRRCAWWPGTPTPATSSPPTRRWSPTSSRCWPATARPRAATRPTSRRPSWVSPTRWTTSTASSRPWRSTPSSGSIWSSSCRPGPDPAGWVARSGNEVVPKLAEIDPAR